ncbi:SusD/RagB family nutrient-binding outer membrane lipoprotein [Algibacter agarivorans]|uniref:SusD/RagB family nutrient-binding outer membrane lipoprotein n=1 Tax=Algibacter agarivorans TaxID=1109741 RepID=A0ABP9GNC1_9FLAO
MKKYILKFILAFLTVLSFSCESYLDVNQDPNVLSDTDQPKILLPNAQVGLAHTMMGYDIGFGGGFWTQYWTQSYTASQFKDLCEFEEESFNDAYVEFSAVVLNDLKRMQTLSGDLPENQGYAYIAEALSIFTWQVMTDLWGDIPYSEALQGNEGITAPKFDASEDIYADLETRINALLAIDVSELTQIDAKFDFIYEGDLNAWEKFANSLKLKLMMRQSETSNYSNSTALSFISSASFIDASAKISGAIWEDDKEGKRHPMREFQEGGANTLSINVIGCKSFIDYLNVNSDPRIDALFTAPSGGHLGAFFGDFDSKKDSDEDGTLDEDEDYSEALFAGDTDLIIMSDWEVNFFIAEVYARASDLVNAKTYYEMGVTASLAQNGFSATDIITTGYATWVDGTTEANLKQIAMQKWVANANYQHLESFVERNRTKYPALNPIDIKLDRNDAFLNFPLGDLTNSVNGRDKTNAKLPSSPVYPADVMGRNINAPSQKPDLLQKVWWDKKVGN